MISYSTGSPVKGILNIYQGVTVGGDAFFENRDMMTLWREEIDTRNFYLLGRGWRNRLTLRTDSLKVNMKRY